MPVAGRSAWPARHPGLVPPVMSAPMPGDVPATVAITLVASRVPATAAIPMMAGHVPAIVTVAVVGVRAEIAPVRRVAPVKRIAVMMTVAVVAAVGTLRMGNPDIGQPEQVFPDMSRLVGGDPAELILERGFEFIACLRGRSP